MIGTGVGYERTTELASGGELVRFWIRGVWAADIRDMARGEGMTYLVRMIEGRQAQVFPMRGLYEKRHWIFRDGVAVIDQSLSSALQFATVLARRHGV